MTGLVMLNSLFLDILRKNFVILCSCFLLLLESVLLFFLVGSLSPESLFSDESLDLGGFIEGLVTLLDFSPHDVLSHIILLPQGEHLSDVISSLGSKSSGLITISDSLDLCFSLLGDLESNNCKIRSTNAPSY